MWNVGLVEAQAEIKIAGKNINNLKYAGENKLMAEGEQKLKSLLMKVKEESEKVGFKTQHLKTKIMAAGPITYLMAKRCRKMETVIGYIILCSKITVDSDCSYKIKRCLLLEKKSCDTPRQHIQKQRPYFANKGPSSQGYGFSSGHVDRKSVV